MLTASKDPGSRFARSAILLLVLLGACDQGPELGQVVGTVTLDGDPLADATVIFQPQAGGPASHGTTDEAGRYELAFSSHEPGAVLGEHNVTVETYRVRLDENGTPVERPEHVPARYNSQTELIHEVHPGEQTIDLPLQSE